MDMVGIEEKLFIRPKLPVFLNFDAVGFGNGNQEICDIQGNIMVIKWLAVEKSH